jgi:hypothetical protein
MVVGYVTSQIEGDEVVVPYQDSYQEEQGRFFD